MLTTAPLQRRIARTVGVSRSPDLVTSSAFADVSKSENEPPAVNAKPSASCIDDLVAVARRIENRFARSFPRRPKIELYRRMEPRASVSKSSVGIGRRRNARLASPIQ